MKTRQGFVSNSSSSSFVVVAKKEDFDKILNESDKYTRQVINELGFSTHEFAGTEVIALAGMNGNESSFEYMTIDLDDDVQDEYDIHDEGYEGLYYEFESKLKQLGAIVKYTDC